MLVQIDLGYACFGIVLEGGFVIEAPPIARWMIGKRAADVARWVEKKHGGWYVL